MADDEESFLYGDTEDTNNEGKEVTSPDPNEEKPVASEEVVSMDNNKEVVANDNSDSLDPIDSSVNDNGGASNGEVQEAEMDANVVNDANQEENDDEDEDSDEEDNIRITIDHGKIDAAKSSYQSLVSRSSSLPSSQSSSSQRSTAPAPSSQATEKKGRFTTEQFDHVGTIGGKPAYEADPNDYDDKPWRKPGADVTDYFNYGFTEETWQAYCNRQRKIRAQEVVTAVLPGAVPFSTFFPPGPKGSRQNDSSRHQESRESNSSSSNNNSNNKTVINTIPTLGGGGSNNSGSSTQRPFFSLNQRSRKTNNDNDSTSSVTKTRERERDTGPTPISVMTSDKRGGSGFGKKQFDFSVPPPDLALPPPLSVNYDDPYGDAYNGVSYEPTMESQWSVPPPSAAATLNLLTPMNQVTPINQAPPMNQVTPINQAPPMNHLTPINQVASAPQITTVNHGAPINQVPLIHPIPPTETDPQQRSLVEQEERKPTAPELEAISRDKLPSATSSSANAISSSRSRYDRDDRENSSSSRREHHHRRRRNKSRSRSKDRHRSSRDRRRGGSRSRSRSPTSHKHKRIKREKRDREERVHIKEEKIDN